MSSKHPVTIYFYPLLEDGKLIDENKLFTVNEQEHTSEYVLYIHIPYCLSHCSFCPFNTKVIKDASETNIYVEALCNEIEIVSQLNKDIKISSVYYGGGSPSVLEPDNILRIHKLINDKFNIRNAEISFEGELRTLTKESIISILRDIKVNRISLGLQTFDDKLRKMFQIPFTSTEASKMIYKLKNSGVDEINIDMMYGLPGHNIECLLNDVNRLIELEIDSVDYYRLHPYSLPFSQRGEWTDVADKQKADFIDELIKRFQLAGYDNVCDQIYSKVGLSKYSQLMWGNASATSSCNIIGLGASSRGYINGRSYMNMAEIKEYIEKINQNKLPIEKISDQCDNMERNFVFSPKYFHIPSQFTKNETFKQVVDQWMKDGLVYFNKDFFSLTNRGKLQVDSMIIDAMSDSQYKLATGIERKISNIENLRTGRF